MAATVKLSFNSVHFEDHNIITIIYIIPYTLFDIIDTVIMIQIGDKLIYLASLMDCSDQAFRSYRSC